MDFRAQDKVNDKSDNDDDEIFKEADHDLEQILELEVLNKPSPSPNSAIIKQPTVIITPKLTLLNSSTTGGGENNKNCEKER